MNFLMYPFFVHLCLIKHIYNISILIENFNKEYSLELGHN